jgi:DNA recombination protein RmuC
MMITSDVCALRWHARRVKEHVDELAAKSYWQRFDPVPVFVVMFVPSETFIHTVIEQQPELQNYALERRVVMQLRRHSSPWAG